MHSHYWLITHQWHKKKLLQCTLHLETHKEWSFTQESPGSDVMIDHAALYNSDIVIYMFCNNCIYVYELPDRQAVVYKRWGGSQCSLTASNHGSIYFVRKSKENMKSHAICSFSVCLWLSQRERNQGKINAKQSQIIRINENY